MVSREFKVAVKMADVPAWRIAYAAGVHPNVLSKIMSGAIRVKPGDARVVRVGGIIGLTPEECFEGNVLANKSVGDDNGKV
jgi:hypothetical protein